MKRFLARHFDLEMFYCRRFGTEMFLIHSECPYCTANNESYDECGNPIGGAVGSVYCTCNECGQEYIVDYIDN